MADREELPVPNEIKGVGGITGTNPGIEEHRQFRQMDNPISNARLVAELQAVALGIRLVGLDRLPTVMGADRGH